MSLCVLFENSFLYLFNFLELIAILYLNVFYNSVSYMIIPQYFFSSSVSKVGSIFLIFLPTYFKYLL